MGNSFTRILPRVGLAVVLALSVILPLAAAGCGPALVASGAGQVVSGVADAITGRAQATLADEKVLLVLERSYQAFARVTLAEVQAGRLKGEKAAAVARADNQAYAAVKAARAGYKAGDATGNIQRALAVMDALSAANEALKA